MIILKLACHVCFVYMNFMELSAIFVYQFVFHLAECSSYLLELNLHDGNPL